MDNPKQLQLLSFCTGYGGIERGLEIAGVQFRTIAHVEIEAFAIANLVAKMENNEMVPAPVWTNVKTLPLQPFRDRVDILTGGYPCQPFSSAGQRKGQEDPRHLWPFIIKAIDVIGPRRVFFENVEGHISLGLQEVIESLEIRGYKTAWGIFSAEEVGLPHRRKRVFIMADCECSCNRRRWSGERFTSPNQELGNSEHNGSSTIGNIEELQGSSDEQKGEVEQSKRSSEELANSNSKRLEGLWQCNNSQGWKASNRQPRGSGQVLPSRPNEPQHNWEEPRTIKSSMGRTANGTASRVDELRLLGNGVVPQTAALAWEILNQKLNNK